MRLLTNNPTKRAGLEGYGLEIVGRVGLPVLATPENLRYLRTKRDRMGHDLPGLAAFEDEATEASADLVAPAGGRRAPCCVGRRRTAACANRCRPADGAPAVSGEGRPGEEPVDAAGLSLAVVATRWHERITGALLESALRTAAECGVASPDGRARRRRRRAPRGRAGARRPARRRRRAGRRRARRHPALRVRVRRRDRGLTRVSLDSRTPVGNGVLTCDTEQQALDRAGLPDSVEDKGREAVLAALHTALVLRDLEGHPGTA
jgi:6,7-dimethyl-8-ribityllumazine synthase